MGNLRGGVFIGAGGDRERTNAAVPILQGDKPVGCGPVLLWRTFLLAVRMDDRVKPCRRQPGVAIENASWKSDLAEEFNEKRKISL